MGQCKAVIHSNNGVVSLCNTETSDPFCGKHAFPPVSLEEAKQYAKKRRPVHVQMDDGSFRQNMIIMFVFEHDVYVLPQNVRISKYHKGEWFPLRNVRKCR